MDNTNPMVHDPEMVRRARELALVHEFTKGCIPEVGRLLQALAASALPGMVGEIGTGCGEGAAWLLSGLRHDQRLVSVELERERQQVVSELFSDYPKARFLQGDWRELKAYAPFSLLFIDAGDAKDEGAPEALELLAVGGTAVLDDFTYSLDGLWQGRPDPRREFWLKQPDLLATEVLTTPTTSVILAVRKA